MYNNSVNTLRELLETAIKVSGRELFVFDYTPDNEYKPHGLYIAEKEDGDFQVVIIPEERNTTMKTIAGDRPTLTLFYNIYTPKYDDGDASVGMDGYYYTDIEEDWQWSFPSATDIAVKVMTWIMEYEIRLAVNNTAEYIYTRELEEIDIAQ